MTLRFSLLLTATVLGLGACTKDDGGTNDKIPRSKVDARVNGSLFYASESQAQLSGDVLTIVGTRNSGTGKESAIVLQIKHYKGPATYAIDTATQASYTDFGELYTADSGAVVISDINSVKFAGSFGFRAAGTGGTLRISSGVIDVYK